MKEAEGLGLREGGMGDAGVPAGGREDPRDKFI